MLFANKSEQFWESIRNIIREEVQRIERGKTPDALYETPGMTNKPLYKIADVCALFKKTKPTIYDWVRHGKLMPYKSRSRVYFLHQDIQQLVQFKT